MRDATSATEVWEASTKLKSSNESIFSKIERTSGNTGALDDLLSYWCVKADKSSFNLEKFVMAALHENTRAAAGIFSYIQVRLNNLRLRANPEAGGVLSFESGAALLQALQNHIPMEKLRRVMHVLQQGFQLHRTNPQAALAQQRQNQQYQAQQQAQLQRSIREGIANPVSQDSAFIGQQQAGYLNVSMPPPGGAGTGAAGIDYAGSGGPGGSVGPKCSTIASCTTDCWCSCGTGGRDRIAPTRQQTNLMTSRHSPSRDQP